MVSVCGGRGRCSTCRVRIVSGLDEGLQNLHEWLAHALLIAAAAHAAAALVMGRLERVRLVRAMVTGVKRPY